MKRVNEYNIVDHGIDHEQYFQGCGVSFTPYDECATGIGNSPNEALEDALECLAQSGTYDVEDLERRIKADDAVWYSKKAMRTRRMGEEQHYYVSVRVN